MPTDLEPSSAPTGVTRRSPRSARGSTTEGSPTSTTSSPPSRAGSWARASLLRTGRRSPTRASSSSTGRPPTSSPTATATTSATGRRPRSSSASPSRRRSCRSRGTRRVARVWVTCFRNREEREDPGAFLTSDCRGEPQAHPGRLRGGHRPPPPRRHRAGDDVAASWTRTGTPSVEGKTKPYCYHIDQFSELQPIIHKVIEYGQKMGLDMIQGDHEDAPGQIELNFGFDRAEKTADNLSTFRQVCKQVGRELDAFPCFMPKPFMGVSANGCHHNISLWRGDENAFVPDTDDRQKPSQTGLYAIGGIIEHLGALTARHRVDRQLVPPALGHGLLGAGLRRLGLPEPHDRAARLRARPLRVPLRRLGGEPVPLARRAHRRDARRHRPQARSRASPRSGTSTRRWRPARRSRRSR